MESTYVSTVLNQIAVVASHRLLLKVGRHLGIFTLCMSTFEDLDLLQCTLSRVSEIEVLRLKSGRV